MIHVPTMAFPPILSTPKWDTLTEKEKGIYADWRYASRKYMRAGLSNQNDCASIDRGAKALYAAPAPTPAGKP
jgi:hypothetical protein